MDHILNNLGLCNRAGGLTTGEEAVVDGIRSGKVLYVFLANDASKNAQKMILDKSKFYNVEVCLDYTSLELSKAIGKSGRMVIGITNNNFVKILKK